MNAFKNILLAAAFTLTAISAASAQTLFNDQTPVPVPGTSNTNSASESLIQSFVVPGGALYQTFYRQPGSGNVILPGGLAFVPGGASSGINRYQDLMYARADNGSVLTTAAGTPAGAVGISRTAGTSLVLVGEATSSSAKTDKVTFETNMASTYIAGANVPVVVNCNYTGAGTVTAASTTMTVAAYTEVAGVETALTVSAAQQFTGTAANYTFTITGVSGLVVGAHIVVELTMLVTTSAGAATGQINSIALTM